MELMDSLKKACLALCHWTTYTRLIMPDYPFNEGAIVVQLWQALASIDRTNNLKFSFEVNYDDLGKEIGLEFDKPLKNLRADILVRTAEMLYVIEVKSASSKSVRGSNSVPGPVRDDIRKMIPLAEGIVRNKVRCFVLYLTQKSCLNTALTYTDTDGVSEKALKHARRSLPLLDQLVGSPLCVKLRRVSKSTSTLDGTLGDYCYLLEVTHR